MKRLFLVLLFVLAIAPTAYPFGQKKIVRDNLSAGGRATVLQQQPVGSGDPWSTIVLAVVGSIVLADRVGSATIEIRCTRNPMTVSIRFSRGRK